KLVLDGQEQVFIAALIRTLFSNSAGSLNGTRMQPPRRAVVAPTWLPACLCLIASQVGTRLSARKGCWHSFATKPGSHPFSRAVEEVRDDEIGIPAIRTPSY